METKDIITIILASYGALLSTFVFVTQRLDKTARVKVSVNPGFLVGRKGTSNVHLNITATNVGHTDVTLASFSFGLPNKKRMSLPATEQVSFPHDLSSGKSCSLRFPLDKLLTGLITNGYQGIVPLTAIFQDQTGVEHKGKVYKFDVHALPKT